MLTHGHVLLKPFVTRRRHQSNCEAARANLSRRAKLARKRSPLPSPCPIHFNHFDGPALWWHTCTLILGEKPEPMKSRFSLFVVVLALAGVAAAHKNKLARELQNKAGSDSVNVIVQFKADPTVDDEQRVTKHHGKHNGDL